MYSGPCHMVDTSGLICSIYKCIHLPYVPIKYLVYVLSHIYKKCWVYMVMLHESIVIYICNVVDIFVQLFSDFVKHLHRLPFM